MYLYNLTLQQSGGISCCCHANLAGNGGQQLVVAKGNRLEVLQVGDDGRLKVLVSRDVFGVIRALAPLRLPGTEKDYIVVGSDSRRLTIVEYKPDKKLEAVHQETFDGARIFPGQMLAVDPRGKAIMVAGCEKQKLVYVVNRDRAGRLTMSSPLEAQKSHTLVFALVGLDCGFDNPTFAAIEVESADHTKHITFYELELGLNRVVRKQSQPIDQGSNMLLAVPGGELGPGGVLVCAENYVVYKQQHGEAELRTCIPRRDGLPRDKGVLITSAATYSHRRNGFYFLVQTEHGDVFKATLRVDGGGEATGLRLTYVDTIPVASAMSVSSEMLLFAASEVGEHAQYSFGHIDCGPSVPSCSSTSGPVTFQPTELRNLSLVDKMESLMPLMDMKVAGTPGADGEPAPEIFAACGTGSRSSLRILRLGLAAGDLVNPQKLSRPALGVWTLKRSRDQPDDELIVISDKLGTMVVPINKDEDDHGLPLFMGTPTLCASLLGRDTIVQVHSRGFRLVAGDGRHHDWSMPGVTNVVKAACNERQLVLALSGGELKWYELDDALGGGGGRLLEMGEVLDVGDIACMALQPVPEGKRRSILLALGFHDSKVRIALLNNDAMQLVATLALACAPESLAFSVEQAATLHVNVGLQNGCLARAEVDPVTGQLSEDPPRVRFLGLKPLKVVPVSWGRCQALLCLSTRPWLGYDHHGRFRLTPLSYAALDCAASFSEGLVAVTSGSDELRGFYIRPGEAFNQTCIPLSGTPRKLIVHTSPKNRYVVLIEADQVEGMEVDGEQDVQRQQAAVAANLRSCIRVVDAGTGATTCMQPLPAAFGLCWVRFDDKSQPMVAVGTALELQCWPKQTSSGGLVHIYRLSDDGVLELVHRTTVQGIPRALCEFRGRLLVGAGRKLGLYSMGRKKLLQECELETDEFRGAIAAVHAAGGRQIRVVDAQEAFFYVTWHEQENRFSVDADSTTVRWMTASASLDSTTMAGADKFGNIFCMRMPDGLAEMLLQQQQHHFAETTKPGKLDQLVEFHVGEVVTSLQKACLVAGGSESLLFSTDRGSIGALCPFACRADVDFFAALEMHMRQEDPPLCGRDHLAFRSSYFPVKGVVDGDLCERFVALPAEAQARIAAALDCNPKHILRKLDEMRDKMPPLFVI